jgi:hypothetical protein
MAARGLAWLFFNLVMIFGCTVAHANNIEVGGESGWVVPPEKSDDMYNHWASLNRFQVGDTICTTLSFLNLYNWFLFGICSVIFFFITAVFLLRTNLTS